MKEMYLGTLFDVELVEPLTHEKISDLVKAKRLKSKLISEYKGISIYRASQITQDELISFCETLSSENAKKLLDLVEREQSIVQSEFKENINKIDAKIADTEIDLVENAVKENIEYTYIWWIIGIIAIFVFIGILVF
ncbi:hypothetical protein [Acinetobacter sp. UC24323]|uniref:hypothetical protein n=1 Tax=Acinetobacter sp. UC24323 TaxID=2839946 RepID=UPI00209D87C0|nr:hypothetical protein [Acinetobacter sp. UC24323]MCO9048752.1 hypothetical protein [Acinetobacter sp. UC24323]